MFWLGDSRDVGWRFLRYIPLEIRAGIRDNIPLCCVFVYISCILVCLTTNSLYRLRDGTIFEFVYRIEADFKKTGYWRCPLCKWRGKVNKIRWDTKGYS